MQKLFLKINCTFLKTNTACQTTTSPCVLILTKWYCTLPSPLTPKLWNPYVFARVSIIIIIIILFVCSSQGRSVRWLIATWAIACSANAYWLAAKDLNANVSTGTRAVFVTKRSNRASWTRAKTAAIACR